MRSVLWWILGGIVAIGMLAYLLYALLKVEEL
ncbi:MAG: potassium-transporting ATPase subunit F [Alicyclobacillaceae bacterium]|nr:potassium-transporting ATPase subunit F [Alicyclobacillaceae bacterium]